MRGENESLKSELAKAREEAAVVTKEKASLEERITELESQVQTSKASNTETVTVLEKRLVEEKELREKAQEEQKIATKALVDQ